MDIRKQDDYSVIMQLNSLLMLKAQVVLAEDGFMPVSYSGENYADRTMYSPTQQRVIKLTNEAFKLGIPESTKYIDTPIDNNKLAVIVGISHDRFADFFLIYGDKHSMLMSYAQVMRAVVNAHPENDYFNLTEAIKQSL